jgi:hypothetical protein
VNLTRSRLRSALVAFLATLTIVAATATAAGASSMHFTGTLADGDTWIADVPEDWNGTLPPLQPWVGRSGCGERTGSGDGGRVAIG